MENGKLPIVLAIKLKDGNDVLGFFLGESLEGAENPFMTVYRALYINLVQLDIDGKRAPMYSTQPYFSYAGHQANIPMSEISTFGIASDFFIEFFKNQVGYTKSQEEILQKSYTDYFEQLWVKEGMENSDSFYVKPDVVVLQ